MERKGIIAMELGSAWVWGAGVQQLFKTITYSCILVNIIVQYKFHQSGIPWMGWDDSPEFSELPRSIAEFQSMNTWRTPVWKSFIAMEEITVLRKL